MTGSQRPCQFLRILEMFRKFFMIIVLSVSSHHALSICLEEEVEMAERCVDRKKIHDVQFINRLQSLIDEAKEGEYIFFKSGTYEIDSSQETALLMTGKKSLTLLGEDHTIIKTKQEDKPVLTIESSQDITIKNLTFTHDTKDRCDSPVMKLSKVKDVKILETTLEGSGTQAITINNSHNIEIKGGQATKNSEGVFDIKDSQNVTIRNMVIEGNDNSGRIKKGILDIENSRGILFSYNVIKNNKNAYFKKIVHSQDLEIEGNEFRDNGFSNYDINETIQQETKSGQVLWSKNVNIHPQLPPFRAEFVGTLTDNIANIKLINLYQIVAKQEQVVQIIEGLDTHTIPDDQGRYVRIEDANFDGYQDIFLINSVKAEDSIYLFWLFDPVDKMFIQNDELNGISNPVVDSHKKQILSTWKNSAVNSGTNYYEFIDGQVTMVRQELKDVLETGGYQWTVKERQDNEMKMIEQRWIKEEQAPELIQEIWQQLDKINNHDNKACAAEKDAVRFLYCHLKKVINDVHLETLAKLPIFVQGPHQEAQLNLEAKNDFGYYNKEFVMWLNEKWEAASQDSHFRTWTAPMYRRYIQKLARTFYEVALQLKNYPEDFGKEKRNYLTKKNASPHCCHYPWFHPVFVEEAPQAVNMSVAFWIRRSIDGTDQEWREGLRRLLETYDMEFLNTMDDQNLFHYQTTRQQVASIAPRYCQYHHPIVLLSSSKVLTYSSFKAALQQANSGDVIWLCPGTYDESIHLDGRSHLFIYGDQAHLWVPSSTEPLITIKNAQYIEISGLHLALEKIQEDSTCLHLTDSHHIYLRDLSIENCGQYGMWVSQVDEVEITGNQFHHSQEGVTVQDSNNLLLKYNRFMGNRQKNVSIPKKEDKEAKVFKNRWRDENEVHPSLKEQNDSFKIKDLKSQASQGNWVSQLMLSFYWNHEDDEESFKWLSQAAHQGYAKAQYQLGWMCYEGRGNCQALDWFQKAAKQGHLKAQSLLARWYLEGKNIPQNFAQAAFWARKAAQQGDAQAQNILAGLYYEGKGLPQEIALATYWVTHSARGGYLEAQNNLGQLYYQGKGVPQDFNQAAYWFAQAAQQGHSSAQSYLKWMKEQTFIK